MLRARESSNPTPFFEFPAEVRTVIYTTNAVESLHMSLRNVMFY
jgi:putative transposase